MFLNPLSANCCSSCVLRTNRPLLCFEWNHKSEEIMGTCLTNSYTLFKQSMIFGAKKKQWAQILRIWRKHPVKMLYIFLYFGIFFSLKLNCSYSHTVVYWVFTLFSDKMNELIGSSNINVERTFVTNQNWTFCMI